MNLSTDPTADFVTVVTVETPSIDFGEDFLMQMLETPKNTPPSYVTVLKIDDKQENENTSFEKCDSETVEEVTVYRLPGERLGFGLKFEGGTKTTEFVKRLFIQSCAPDSPASRVQSSWGKLSEGDEVLEIDSIPVNKMTRIDCVRSLKDSNVVIKLLVKHFIVDRNEVSSKNCLKLIEDKPHVISAEKKRTPPPPPVPPRKTSRKLNRDGASQVKMEANTDNGSLPASSRQSSVNCSKKAPHRKTHTIGKPQPPDAEVYLDLFANENMYNLRTESESDDTGSSISTIVDRLVSYPNTSNSSFSNSLPSTPTTNKKPMDMAYLNPFINDEFQITSTNDFLVTKLMSSEDNDDIKKALNLQPNVNFQDAPLSCGNEDLNIMETELIRNKANYKRSSDENSNESGTFEEEFKNIINTDKKIANNISSSPLMDKKDTFLIETNNNYLQCDESLHFNLPRLVDFVPKKQSSEENLNCIDGNETKATSENCKCSESNCTSENENYFWITSSQLTRIGEEEEKSSDETDCNAMLQNNCDKSTVEHKTSMGEKYEANSSMEQEKYTTKLTLKIKTPENSDIDDTMEIPPSSSRTPPDGYEFSLSCQEQTSTTNDISSRKVSLSKPIIFSNVNVAKQTKPQELNTPKQNIKLTNVQEKVAVFSSPKQESNLSFDSKLSKTHKSSDDIFISANQIDFGNDIENVSSSKSRSSTDKVNQQILPEFKNNSHRIHTRSQSLIDVATFEQNMKMEKLNNLKQQRKKGFSKLKGLVIPEKIPEVEPKLEFVIDLPEILSKDAPPSIAETKINVIETYNKPKENQRNRLNSSVYPVLNTPTIPKYSPAFKRKSLQVYSVPNTLPKQSTSKDTDKCSSNATIENVFINQHQITTTPLTNSLQSNDAPKSLESLTSPTRSDCSFDYNCSSPDLKHKTKKSQYLSEIHLPKLKSASKNISVHQSNDPTDESENESDNDSAVSSSQSSYCRYSSSTSLNEVHSNSSIPINANEAIKLPSNERNHSVNNQNNIISEFHGEDRLQQLTKQNSKVPNVDAINRKNILASAKCRSGGDLNRSSSLPQKEIQKENAILQEKPKNGNIEQRTQYLLTDIKSNKDSQHINIAFMNIATDTEEDETIKPKIPEENIEPIINKCNTTIIRPVAKGIVPKSTIDSSKLKKYEILKEESNKGFNSRANDIKTRPKISNAKSSVNDIKNKFENKSCIPTLSINSQTSRKSSMIPSPKIQSIDLKKNLTKQKETTNSIKKTDIKEAREVPVTKMFSNLIQEIIKENNIDDDKNVIVVNLQKETTEKSVGITLAGGSDYETKEITIHSIRKGSPAYRNGQLQKGDRILAINEKNMKNVTHSESMSFLKSSDLQISLVVLQKRNVVDISPVKSNKSLPPPARLINESPPVSAVQNNCGTRFEICINKDIGGLGFSISGGYGSPLGDVPLRIKKLFKGGVAEKDGQLKEGDEILAVNKIDVAKMSRIEVWGIMKKLPEGSSVVLSVRR